MKATGIVRRIDDLGRVVIPKEIRRTLRIREGDPLEIFVDRDGEVILKKYSPIGEMGVFAREYAESLFETTNHIVIISDRDTIISVSGGTKKDYLEKRVGSLLEESMEQRKPFFHDTLGEYEVCKDMRENFTSIVISPIISGGDPIGTVILASKEENLKMSDMEVKMADTAAGFLGKQIEH